MTLLPLTNRNQTLNNLRRLKSKPYRSSENGKAFIKKLVRRGQGNGWRVLGQGVNGTVFNNGQQARKFMLNSNRSEYNLIRNLVYRGVNYIPKVHTLNMHKNYTMFSMNKIINGKTLHNYLTNHPEEKTRAKRMKAHLAMNLHERGISHGDLHDNNVMVEMNPNGSIKKMWIIDFGRFVRVPHGKTEQEAYNAMGKRSFLIGGKIVHNRGYGSEYGANKRICRTDKTMCQIPNFRVGHTTRNTLGRKVYLGNNGQRFRMSNGKKVLVTRITPKPNLLLKSRPPGRKNWSGLQPRIKIRENVTKKARENIKALRTFNNYKKHFENKGGKSRPRNINTAYSKTPVKSHRDWRSPMRRPMRSPTSPVRTFTRRL